MAASRREQPYRRVLQIGGAVIQVDIRIGQGSLRNEDIVAWVRRATEAVAVYYGRFPVQRARVIVGQSEEKDESIHGTTWGDVQGVQGLTRMRLGSAVTEAKLEEDWTMTHELVHMALSSLPDESHWPEEGIATYVEPIARTQAGQLPVEQVWAGMVRGMPQGEPLPGDKGLDQTHTWGRTYWGGAMFCLVADVQIRKATEIARGCRTLFRLSWRHKTPSIQSGRYHEFSRPVIERQGRPFSLTCIAMEGCPDCGGPRSTLATAGCASRFPWDRTGCERTSGTDSKGHDKPAQAAMTQQAM
jgi:hypothetical protein